MNRISQYYASDDLFEAAERPELFAFDGHNLDPSVPLQFNQHRHYDPTPGMWLTEDPVGFAGDEQNVRKYVGEPLQ